MATEIGKGEFWGRLGIVGGKSLEGYRSQTDYSFARFRLFHDSLFSRDAF